MKTYRLDELALLSEERAVQRYFDGRNYRIWRGLLLFLLVPSGVLLGIYLAEGQFWRGGLAGANLLALALLWLLRQRPWFEEGFRALLLTFVLVEYGLAAAASSEEGFVIALSYFFLPLLVAFLRLRTSEYLLLVVSSGAVGGATILWSQDEQPLSALVGQLLGLAIPPTVVLVVALLLARRDRLEFLGRWRSAATRERDRLRMREELADARRIQLSMLPESAPALPWLELSGSSLPATEVGGDFYDYLPLPDGRMVVIVGDVAGHGVSSGLVLAAVKGGLHLLRSELDDPVAVLRRLDGMVRETVRWRVIVTLLVAILDPREKRLTVVTAGHPPLLQLTAEGVLRQVGLAAPPLGTRLPSSFREAAAPLASDDVLLLYSDGATELADLRQDQFGSERLGEALRRARGRVREAEGSAGSSSGEGAGSAAGGKDRSAPTAAIPRGEGAGAATIRERVLDVLARHKSDAPQRDDITLVVARVGDLGEAG